MDATPETKPSQKNGPPMGDPKVNKFFSGSGAKSPHVPWQNDAGS